jgi:hypothetical protein
MEKEFSITILGDLFHAISFLRFLEHFWNRWNTGTHWNTLFHPEKLTGKLRYYPVHIRVVFWCGKA